MIRRFGLLVRDRFVGEVGSSQHRVASLDALRGIAALAVAVFHFVGPPSRHPAPQSFATFASYGWAGVDVFFVISGFAMTWILLHSRDPASPAAAGRFVGRRLLRLMPPYLACCILVVALQFASSLAPGFRGEPFAWPSLARVACNVAYACDAVSLPWFNPVFWTLAIEVQFYAVVAALFLLSARVRPVFVYAVVGCLVAASLAVEGKSLLRYAPHFAIGAAMARQVQMQPRHTWFLVAAVSCTVVVGYGWGPIQATAVAIAALACLVPWQPAKWMLWLGAISYSVYLVHVPIGGRVTNLLERLEPTRWEWTGIAIAATAVTLIAGWVAFLLVEKPSIALSRRWLSSPPKHEVAVPVALASG